jgi:hypothetical protein
MRRPRERRRRVTALIPDDPDALVEGRAPSGCRPGACLVCGLALVARSQARSASHAASGLLSARRRNAVSPGFIDSPSPTCWSNSRRARGARPSLRGARAPRTERREGERPIGTPREAFDLPSERPLPQVECRRSNPRAAGASVARPAGPSPRALGPGARGRSWAERCFLGRRELPRPAQPLWPPLGASGTLAFR